MLRTIFVALVFWLITLLTSFCLPGMWLLNLLPFKTAEKKYLIAICIFWARLTYAIAGVKVVLRGRENLPSHDRICFVSNHQSYGDIPLLLGFLKRRIGFITKKELAKAPILSLWMRSLRCIFIDRGQGRKALRSIEKGLEQIERGEAMAIFPEGTRAKDGKMKPFKTGGILMAARRNITIVPVTIDGLYRVYELTKRITPCSVTLTLHPPIETGQLSREEQKALPQQIEDQIRSSLSVQET